MRGGFREAVPVTETTVTPEQREQFRENYKVLEEIRRACLRNDAALVKRLAALIVVPE